MCRLMSLKIQMELIINCLTIANNRFLRFSQLAEQQRVFNFRFQLTVAIDSLIKDLMYCLNKLPL